MSLKRLFPWGLPVGVLAALGVATLVVVASATLPVASPAFAENEQDVPTATTVSNQANAWLQRIDTIDEEAAGIALLTEAAQAALRERLDELVDEVRTALANDDRQIGPLQQELGSLGASPEEGDSAESDEIAALRTQLTDRVARVATRIQIGQVVLLRADNLRTTLSLQNKSIYRDLWQRSPSLWRATTWRVAADEIDLFARRLVQAPVEWWSLTKQTWRPGQYILVVFTGLLAIALALPVRRRLRRRLIRQEARVATPVEAQKVGHAVVKGLAEIILPVAGLGALAAAIAITVPDHTLFETILVSLCLAVLLFNAITGVARIALAPATPVWRLVPTTEEGARQLNRRVRLFALYLAAIEFLGLVADFFGQPSAEALAVILLIADTGFVILLLSLLPARFWETGVSDRAKVLSAGLRMLIAVFLIAVPILDIAGYVTLSTFLLTRILVTVMAVATAVLVRQAFADLLTQIFDREGRYFYRVDRWMRLSEGTARLATFWCGLLFDIMVTGVLVYGLLIYYGLPFEFLNLWLGRVLTGITVGSVTISLLDIVIAIALFVVGLIVTGAVRRRLARFLVNRTRMDPGIRESIASGVGYVGIIVSILIAIGALGLDLSNLALVASALSVGIGFGLRTVVENFVAGLLLLIERPIKAGDWVVTGDQQGLVKRISVRSTEIETFDRASVIVPNADLISQSVQNWTHKNRMARIIVPVGVAYGSDTKKVRETLLACAQAHEDVLDYPASVVLFLSFGASSLDFELRCFISDAFKRLTIGSDLHFAIDEAFRDAGIEIAFPQRDIHIRDANLGGVAANPAAEAPDFPTD